MTLPGSDVGLSAEQRAVRDAVREFAREAVRPSARAADESGSFPEDAWDGLADLDLTGLTTPERFGGVDAHRLTYALVNEEVAYGSLAVATALSVHCLATACLAEFGDETRRERWLPEMVDGRPVGAFALSEPHAGSNPAAMSTTAVREGDAYVLNGEKQWVTDGRRELRRPCADRRRRPGLDHPVPRPRRRRRADRRGAGVQARPARVGHHPADVRRRAHPRREPTRRRGTRAVGGAVDPHGRPDRHRGGGGRAGAGRARRGGGLRRRARAVRRAALGDRDDPARDRRHGRAGRRRPRARPRGRPARRRRRGSPGRRLDRQVRRQRGRRRRHRRGGPGSRRLRYVTEFDVERLYRDARIATTHEGTPEIQREVIARDLLG